MLSPGHPFADKATGAAHACGHNAQLASMLGCAVGLRPWRTALRAAYACWRRPRRNTLRSAGGLAEARGRSTVSRVSSSSSREGADDIDMAMMVHSETDAPQPRAVVAGAAGGFIGKELRFLGKEAHAGGAPWEGVNALNAASLAIAAIHANRETFRDEV